MRARFTWLVIALAACATGARDEGTAVTPHAAQPTTAIVPGAGFGFGPSEARATRAMPNAGQTLADVETCGNCHADVEAQWRTSAHAFASFNNPIYRAAVERFRKERGARASRFCAGCHDVALLVDGAMDEAVDPKDKRAHAGITCRVCHGVANTRPDGNGSYTLDLGDFPLPKTGDPESVRRHKARAAPSPLRTAALCGTCHRAFLNEATGNAAFLSGQDDLTPWMRSAFGASTGERVDALVPERDCRGCHMPREEASDPAAKSGKIASHRFIGAHSWLAQMRRDAEQVRRVEEALKTAVTLDVAALVMGGGARVLPADGAAVAPGERVVVEVVARNVGVGHRFPGGVMDAQDTWLEVVIEDARGRTIAEAGTRQEATGDDATAHRFASAMAGSDGKPLLARETQLFEANVYNHTIPPRDAEIVRYAFEAPRELSGPLRVVARMRHRARSLALQRAACEDARTARGRAFGREGLRRVARAIDPCPPQPVIDVARAEAHIGPGATSAQPEPAFGRAFDHGLAMLHELGERQDEARPSLSLALDLAKDDRQRAMALGALAQLAAEEGRTDEALDLATRAGALAPGHPAIARVRGEALAASWRWREAAPFFEESTIGAARDDALWARLAITWGGAGRDREALDAAQRGLLLQPRDADLLRVQALSLRALGADAALAGVAEAAWLAHRAPDAAPLVRARCSETVPGCALERLPVHVHEMRSDAADPRRSGDVLRNARWRASW